MRLLPLFMLLITSVCLNAQELEFEKKPLKLDLRPDFNAELKRHDKNLYQETGSGTEEKIFFDKTQRPKHQFTFGVAAGNAMTQEGVKPLTEKQLKPKMTTVFEK